MCYNREKSHYQTKVKPISIVNISKAEEDNTVIIATYLFLYINVFACLKSVPFLNKALLKQPKNGNVKEHHKTKTRKNGIFKLIWFNVYFFYGGCCFVLVS